MKKVYELFLLLFATTIAVSPSFAQTASGSLPVLITVDASLTANNKVAVSWTILQNINTDCYNVEKSSDGIVWHSIALVKDTGNNNLPFTYSMIDGSPLRGSNFYRIRSTYSNGNTGLTVIKTVRVNIPGNFILYPNPSSSLVNVSLGQSAPSNWTVSVINSAGQLMTQKKYAKSMTAASIPVRRLPAGIYILEIKDDHSTQQNRLMINHN
jgi:hypothetical protein